MEDKNNIATNKIVAITVSKRLYGKMKYCVSTLSTYYDRKSKLRFKVKYSIVSSDDKENMGEECKRIAKKLNVPVLSGVKNGNLVTEKYKQLLSKNSII